MKATSFHLNCLTVVCCSFLRAGECRTFKMLSEYVDSFREDNAESQDFDARKNSSDSHMKPEKKKLLVAFRKIQTERGSEHDPPVVPFVRPTIQDANGGQSHEYDQTAPGSVRGHCFFSFKTIHLCIDPEIPKAFQTVCDTLVHFANIGVLDNTMENWVGPYFKNAHELVDRLSFYVADEMTDEEFNQLLEGSGSFLSGHTNRSEYWPFIEFLGLSKEWPNDVLFDILLIAKWAYQKFDFKGKFYCYVEASMLCYQFDEDGTMKNASQDDIMPFGNVAGPHDVVFFYSRVGLVMPAYCVPCRLDPMGLQRVTFFTKLSGTEALFFEPRTQRVQKHFYYSVYSQLALRAHLDCSFTQFLLNIRTHVGTLNENRIRYMQPLPGGWTKKDMMDLFTNFTNQTAMTRDITHLDENIVASYLSTVCGGLRLVIYDHIVEEFEFWEYEDALYQYNPVTIQEEHLSFYGSMNSLDFILINVESRLYLPGFYMPWNIQHFDIQYPEDPSS